MCRASFKMSFRIRKRQYLTCYAKLEGSKPKIVKEIPSYIVKNTFL